MNRAFLDRFSRILALVLIVVLLAATKPNFLGVRNLLNILNQASLNVIVAVGMTFTMLIAGIDLSVGSILALTSVMAARFFQTGGVSDMIAGFAVALGLGTFLGVLNGAAIVHLRVPAFLVTFGMMQAARGFAYLFNSGVIYNNFDGKFLFLGKGDVLGVPTPVAIAALVLGLFGLILAKTTMGRRVYMVGANYSSARYSGISIGRTTIFAYALSGLLAALAGLVYISRLNAAEAIIGEHFNLMAIAAAAIGGVSFNGGSGSVFGTVLGALILTIIMNGMNLHGIPTQYQNLATGAAIILAVLLDRRAMRAEV
ncbi:MAG: ABC transporter permease [Planctomycetota bacterium]|jgi:ribose transport system permease protein|nr:ABC transporter permease [Planctomycetota bacterium]